MDVEKEKHSELDKREDVGYEEQTVYQAQEGDEKGVGKQEEHGVDDEALVQENGDKIKENGVEVEKVKVEVSVREMMLEEKYLRLQADFENYKRRISREQAGWVLRANEKLLLALLPVVNDFGRALEAAVDQSDETVKGILMIHDKLLKALEQQGVRAIDIKVGMALDDDDDRVEVVSGMPVAEVEKKGKIMQVVERGYLFDGKVLQRTKVIIGT